MADILAILLPKMSQDEMDCDIVASEPDTIQAINRSTVHRICSGQVILSLATAVKELVENAVDASATNIEVRLKEYGSELLEVGDDGCGVRKENFQALTLKHYTSKLREFNDLESVETLGFRGEALNSLCCLSKVTITTRHASAEHATKLQYDLSGRIVSESPAAREVGTTVVLENLFSGLPVRRKEFMKNLKREYSRMCQLLYAYCIVSKGIKFTCTNQTKAGSKSTVVATEGAQSIRENVISIFGARQVSTLIQVETCEPDEQVLEEFKVKIVPGEGHPFQFECIISNAVHGSGRSTADRQFFYINSRPCELSKAAKLVNEVYRQFNSSQYPFVFLNVLMQRSLVDVNVTPDKRQIFLQQEQLLLAVLKCSLLEAFKSSPSTYKMQNVPTSDTVVGAKRPLPDNKNESKSELNFDLFRKRAKCDNKEPQLCVRQSSLIDNKNFNVSIVQKSQVQKVKEDEEILTPNTALNKLVEKLEENMDSGVGSESNIESSQELENVEVEEFKTKDSISTGKIELQCDKSKEAVKRSVTVRSSMKYLQEALKRCKFNKKGDDDSVHIRFRSEITPASNKSAEQELQRHISKEMFQEMEILGQFNLGFIVTKLGDDLFIIDQHATDEKYNFEQLQLTTVLESQVFVNPKQLELTATNEEILIEHEEVFRKNGFYFVINQNAPATKKVALTAVPISKNWVFGKDDIDEMLFMLQEDSNPSVCRPSRVRAMLASRACRKSVMVGCPLSHKDMRRLVDHMGEIEQPWNCPHGRPTMRHLVNLKLIENI